MVSASAQTLETGASVFNSILSATAHLSQIVRGHAAFSALGLLEEELQKDKVLAYSQDLTLRLLSFICWITPNYEWSRSVHVK